DNLKMVVAIATIVILGFVEMVHEAVEGSYQLEEQANNALLFSDGSSHQIDCPSSWQKEKTKAEISVQTEPRSLPTVGTQCFHVENKEVILGSIHELINF